MEHTRPNPSPQSDLAASNNHTIAALIQESGRIQARLGKSQFNVEGARMAYGAQDSPPPHIFHTARLFTTCSYVMSGWDWRWGEHGGRKASWPG